MKGMFERNLLYEQTIHRMRRISIAIGDWIKRLLTRCWLVLWRLSIRTISAIITIGITIIIIPLIVLLIVWIIRLILHVVIAGTFLFPIIFVYPTLITASGRRRRLEHEKLDEENEKEERKRVDIEKLHQELLKHCYEYRIRKYRIGFNFIIGARIQHRGGSHKHIRGHRRGLYIHTFIQKVFILIIKRMKFYHASVLPGEKLNIHLFITRSQSRYIFWERDLDS